MNHDLLRRLSAVFFISVLLAGLAVPGLAQKPPEGICGRLTEHAGLPVLELWGTPEEAGYAHGYLLADRIVRLVDDYMLSELIVPNTTLYETVLLPSVRRQFRWDEQYEAELRALTRGMQDRLGEDGCRSTKLNRTLTLQDAMAANALADWFGLMCSSVSVWGRLTENGETLTGRNLDFPSTGGMAASAIIVVYRAEAPRRSWVGLSWPGMIGVYTGMNSDGVTMMMHDAPGLPASVAAGFTPRALILREALERAGGDTFIADVQAVFQQRRVMVGNNIHVSGPSRDDAPAAAVFEYDPNDKDQGATVRVPAQNDLVQDALWCTNHMCLRRDPRSCDRFEKLTERVRDAFRNGRTLDKKEIMQLMHDVRQRTTLHSAVLAPDERAMYVQIPSIQREAVKIDVENWLARPTPQTAVTPIRAETEGS